MCRNETLETSMSLNLSDDLNAVTTFPLPGRFPHPSCVQRSDSPSWKQVLLHCYYTLSQSLSESRLLNQFKPHRLVLIHQFLSAAQMS